MGWGRIGDDVRQLPRRQSERAADRPTLPRAQLRPIQCPLNKTQTHRVGDCSRNTDARRSLMRKTMWSSRPVGELLPSKHHSKGDANSARTYRYFNYRLTAPRDEYLCCRVTERRLDTPRDAPERDDLSLVKLANQTLTNCVARRITTQ
ncbi:unnamed protein product, partial [Iphiclides podalirius]